MATAKRPKVRVRSIEWTEVPYPKGQQWNGTVGDLLVAAVYHITDFGQNTFSYSVEPSGSIGNASSFESAKSSAQKALNTYVRALAF